MDIRTFDDPVLRKKAKEVPRVNKTVRKILDDMLETMRVASGVGLAAPQVGISKRIVVVDVGEGPYFLVNPEIVSRSDEDEVSWEGCLSWPGYIGEVERPKRIVVKALDRDGHDVWVEGEGFLARALAHEIDHLDGVLFVDRAETVTETPEEETPLVAPEDEQEITAVFMGSPRFSVPSLDELVRAGVKIPLVVTQPDRPYGRRQVLTPTPVKERAESLGIPVLTCEDVSLPGVIEAVKDQSPHYVVVVAFGQRLPAGILDAPQKACLNVHPSLLPRYRGGNPIQRAVMNGDQLTGVSIMYMTDRMDAGDIVVQKQTKIGPDETFGTLESRLSSLGAHALMETIGLIQTHLAGRTPQDESIATRAFHLRAGEDHIDWSLGSQAIHNLVRGLSPRPGAVTCLGEERIKIWETGLLPGESPCGSPPGQILGVRGDAALVGTGDGVIAVRTVQPFGKKSMSARAFLLGRHNGHRQFGEF